MPGRGFRTSAGSGNLAPGHTQSVGVTLRCTRCGTPSVSSLFYLGPDAHLCRSCGAPFELADPAHDRRSGRERRGGPNDEACAFAEWRSGEDRRRAVSMDPGGRMQTPATA
jgi:hypothetical protein